MQPSCSPRTSWRPLPSSKWLTSSAFKNHSSNNGNSLPIWSTRASVANPHRLIDSSWPPLPQSGLVIPEPEPPVSSWEPFESCIEFAHYHFAEVQNSAAKIDQALDMWAATVFEFSADSPWKTSAELYVSINAINHGDSPWKVYHIHYQGPMPAGTPPKQMIQDYELCM